MHTPFEAFFARQPVVILDGAMATELERRGADLRDALWSARLLIDRPELIRSVHLDYLRAGADVVTTATYQASFGGFARRGIGSDEAERLMCDAVSLATEARDEFWNEDVHRQERMRPLIAASVGPYGATLADGSEYRGGYSLGDRALAEFHLRRLDVLVASRPDLLACETLPCLREALILAQLL
ncbi:MAG: homocysteine S-methyltransferase, partial [Pseudomonadota bacterium]|nr:homocysteine S-methyltransferase [Pseudomonadota bacterium]